MVKPNKNQFLEDCLKDLIKPEVSKIAVATMGIDRKVNIAYFDCDTADLFAMAGFFNAEANLQCMEAFGAIGGEEEEDAEDREWEENDWEDNGVILP